MIYVRPQVVKSQLKVKKMQTAGDRGSCVNKDADSLIGPVLLCSVTPQQQWLCTALEQSLLLGAEEETTLALLFCIKDPFAVSHPKLSAVEAQDSFLFDTGMTRT